MIRLAALCLLFGALVNALIWADPVAQLAKYQMEQSQ